jgi:protein TonB
MAYQALLFCPDEKTARTVTQVLSELDFEVCSCTEPFAAVKKLMAEHFDAVVVDCDNEQNATLLFKSARNSQSNQSALAVAVVEGQAGVAKAFRIGANLVLTKPINVEQAKGTLRVARGLLRKNDSAKPATPAATAAVKPVNSAPAAKPVLVNPNASAARPAAPIASASVPAPKEAPQSSVAASASSAIVESAESTALHSATPKPPSPTAAGWGKIEPPAGAKPKPEATFSEPEATALPSARFSVVPSAGAASAPAPAREQEAIVSTSSKTLSAITASATSELETPIDKVAISSISANESSSPAPTLTFGGTVGSDAEPSSGGSKKLLIAVAAIVLLAVAAYAAWTKFGSSAGTSAPVSVPVKPAAVAPQQTPSSIPSAAVSVPAATAPAVPSSAVATQPASTPNASSPAHKTAEADKAPTRVSDSKPDSSKTASQPVEEDVVAASKVPAKPAAAPIVIRKVGSQPDSAKAGSAKAASADAPMPSIAGIAPAGNGGPLPNLIDASKAPTPVLQTMSVSQGVSQGLVIKKTTPSYPANALRMRIEGSVQLLATISKRGDISAVKVLSGDPSLARAAADAVKQWKYKPYLLDGSPVEIQTQVTVNFKLPR